MNSPEYKMGYVMAWMQSNASEYETATELAEAAEWEHQLTEDEMEDWGWEAAAELKGEAA